MRRVTRLRRMGREELAWRTRAVARIQRDRLAVSLRSPGWERHTLLHALAPDVLSEPLAADLTHGRWAAAQRLLMEEMSSRRARFVLDPEQAGALRSAILERWPDAAADAAERADRILEGRYDVLGYRDLAVAPASRPVDWHFDPVHDRRAPRAFWADIDYLDPSIGDHKVIWELNRHQHWLALGRALWLTGDRRYRTAIMRQLAGWLEANPPLIGVNWASMLELGFRSLSWVWALHFILGSDRSAEGDDEQPWLLDLLMGIDRQLAHVEHNLSYYFSPNTHLTGEALALYVAGHALPELRSSGRWVETGRAILLREIDRQVAPDGGHAERSLHYHRYTLDFYLMALLVAERTGDSAAPAFRNVITRLARFARDMADQHGRFATIGDDDGGMLWPMTGRDVTDVRDSLALAALVLNDATLAPWGVQEEACWLAGVDGAEAIMPTTSQPAGSPSSGPALRAHLYADTGYAVIHDEAGDHAILDVGAHGFLNGGHAHADALALTLTAGGRPLLVDPGTGTYTMQPAFRDNFRRSASHNTVTIDGRSSSEPDGPFHWESTTDARLLSWRPNTGFAWVEGCHSGYGSVIHRRHVIHAAASGWLVVDEVVGAACERADVHWHFDPAWRLACEDAHLLLATHESGDAAWILHDGGALHLLRGDEATGLGWSAPCYGRIVPAWTARFTHGPAPAIPMLTWISAAPTGRPEMSRLPIDHDELAPAIAVRVRRGPRTDVVVLRPGDAPSRNSRSSEAAHIGTDARLLHYATMGDRLSSLSFADATYVWPTGDGPLGIVAEHRVDDLHVEVLDDRLHLAASSPPSRLRLQGTATSGVRAITLNGREAPAMHDVRGDALVITAADWGVSDPGVQTCVA